MMKLSTFCKRMGMRFLWGEDFGAPHETAIAEQYETPVFITHYPAAFKAFYMKPDPNRPEVVLCADMIAPEGYGEIIGGSQRIDDPELLEERFEEHELSQGSLPMVPGSAQIRHGAAFRLRTWTGTHGRLDLRPGSRTRDDSVPADAVPAVSVSRPRPGFGKARGRNDR